MFKLKNILWMGALALSVISCDDFLETAPSDLLSSNSFYQTAAQSEQGVIGVYGDLDQISNYVYLHMSECRSDNAWVEPRPNGLREYAEIGTFRAGEDLGMFNNAWNLLYKVIYDANVAMTKIEGCDFGDKTSIKEQFLGEMLFMRGWCYFELARLWGNVPLIVTPVSPSEVKGIGQSTPREIIETVVIPDLTEAKNKLPYKEQMVSASGSSISSEGRADKMAAEAMLARVYMTLAGSPYNDSNAKSLAKTQLENILNYSVANGDKYWAPTLDEWRKQWMPSTDYYNKYSIFAIQHRTNENRNYLIFNFSPGLPPSYTSRRIFGNSIWVEKTLEYEFERTFSNGKKDGRGIGFTILEGYEEEPNYPAYTNDRENVILEDGTTVEVYTKTMFYKYLPSKPKLAELGMSFDESSMAGDYDWPLNFPILRLEDMMLLYAELLADEGNVVEAMYYVNKIRERAGCDPETASTSADALRLIKRERRVELAGEGIRWFDLVRYGEWQSAITRMFDNYNNPDGTDKSELKNGRYLYPIPLDQMNAVPGLHSQNEGY